MPRRPTRSRRSVGKSKRSLSTGTDSLVIYIHGNGKKPKPDDLKLEWDLALFGRDMGQRTRMAYWADLLHGAEYQESTVSSRSASNKVDIEGALNAAGIRGRAARAFARDLAVLLIGEISMTGNRGAGPGKRMLPLPGSIRKRISKAFLEAFVADTAAYFFKPGMRAKIQDRLRAVLPPVGTPFTLVAHSQGTIVAFEVLATREGHDVREFVTVGSPLGIQEIQDHLIPKPLVVPKAVQRWHNFADPLDPVALDKGLRDDFGDSDKIDDVVLINPRTVDRVRFNPHSAVGYLSHQDVRRVVHWASKFDSMSRFVAARDVVQRLGAEGRHSVLIEILEPNYPAVGAEEEDRDRKLLRRREARELAAIRRRGGSAPAAIDLKTRIAQAAAKIKRIVANKEEARIDELRRFVAARLTAPEIREVARRHEDLRVYALWRSAAKRKLLKRSAKVLQVDAARASYAATGRDITWAVLDTGVQADHPHFRRADGSSVITDVWDCTKPGPAKRLNPAVDKDGHGTHVAGIIAGADPAGSNNGLAPEARLIVYKVLDDKGQGEDAWIIKAIDHITEQNENLATIGIHGINLSLGGPYDSTVYGCGYSPICQELRRLWRSGVLVVVACGNEGQVAVSTPDGEVELNSMMSIGDPANLEDCLSVGSVNADHPHLYGVSAFSSRGPTSDGRVKPDVIAPGERISSCNARWNNLPASHYREESGTSMAAPHVSGLLAAFLSVRREFRGRPDEVKGILLDTCTDLRRDRYHQGRGLPNLMKMLLSV